MHKNYFPLFLLLGIVLSFSKGFSQEVFSIPENLEKTIIGKKYLSIFKDSTAQMTVKEVLKSENLSKFIPFGGDAPNYGYSKAAFFAKFQLNNPDIKAKEVFIEVDYAVLDDVRMYVYDENKTLVREFYTGDLYPHKQRDLSTRNYVFRVKIEPLRTYQVVFRIKNSSTMSFPIFLWEPDKFLKAEAYSMWMFGIYYGIMLVMFLYNFFIFLVLKEKSYLWYILGILTIILFQLSFNGIGFQYIWSNLPAFNHFNTALAASLLIVFNLLFTREFLNTYHNQKVLDRIMLLLVFITSACAIFSFVLSQSITLRLATSLTLPAAFTILYGGFNALGKGFKPARFFVTAWLVYVVGAMLVALRGLGLAPTNFITTYSMQFGSAMEVILLSLALADKINLLRKEIAMRALENERLEKEKERERREMIEQQNEILEQLVAQRTHELYEQNKKMTDSINYAKKIQQAILPSKTEISHVFPEFFIYFKPRDIVSGDFYWFAEVDNKAILAVVDCTGHGVPGAFMSMIGNTLLNQIVLERKVTRPAEILNQLHEEVRFALKQETLEEEEGANQDGMDMLICVFHELHHILEFAGANNSMYLIKNNEIIEYKGDRMGIGGARKNNHERFTNQIIKLEEDVTIYMASDGIVDQFGGPKGSKFMARNLKKLLLELSSIKSMKAQHLQLNKILEEWRGEEKQVDDQLLIGFRISANASRSKAEITSREIAKRKAEQPFKFTR